ncbi:MAG: AAA family ATPase [Bacillales bacterium]|nr:AAA family ATPase [Bacillales bacterium]
MVKNRKKLILVSSPPACGKTYISKKLAENLKHVVYLDKDTLITLSKQIFLVANQEYNRSSEFFEKYIRNEEYDCILDLAFEAIRYEDLVLINAPFTKEVRSASFIKHLEDRCLEHDAELVVVWVNTSVEVCKQRMIMRNSDRDIWKIANWDQYIASRDFSVPTVINNLLIFNNNNDEEFNESMVRIVNELESR